MVKNLRHLREIYGISQTKLAELLGLSQQSIHKYETSSTEPDITTLCMLADFFNTSVDYLVGRTPYSEIRDGGLKERLNDEDVALLSQYSDLTTHTRLCVLDLIKVFHELTATAPKPFQKGSKSRHSPRRRGQPVLAGQRDTDRRPR